MRSGDPFYHYGALFPLRGYGSFPRSPAWDGPFSSADGVVGDRYGGNPDPLGLCVLPASLYFLFISYPGSWIITIAMQAVCFFYVRKQCIRQLQNAGMLVR
mgnify:CR=1 FL=1